MERLALREIELLKTNRGNPSISILEHSNLIKQDPDFNNFSVRIPRGVINWFVLWILCVNCLSKSLYLAPVIHVAPLPRRLPVLRLHSLQQRPHVLPAHRQSISQPTSVSYNNQSFNQFFIVQSMSIPIQWFIGQSISKPVFHTAIDKSTSVP